MSYTGLNTTLIIRMLWHWNVFIKSKCIMYWRFVLLTLSGILFQIYYFAFLPTYLHTNLYLCIYFYKIKYITVTINKPYGVIILRQNKPQCQAWHRTKK
jgi:hypothetical protein